MRRLRFSVLACALVAWACGPTDSNGDGIADGVQDPDSVSLVAPSTPMGTVSGQVLNSRLQPLAGVEVSLNLGAAAAEGVVRSTTTSDQGQFAFQQVPAGAQVLVTMSKSGFASARTTVVVPSTAGNFPINNANAVVGPYVLTELNGSFRILVVTHSGRPAKGAKAIVEASPAAIRVTDSSFYGNNAGVVVVEPPPADDSGVITVSGVPNAEELYRFNGRYDVSIAPIDENGDGIYESAGAVASFTGESILLDPSARVITLPDARAPGGLNVLATNVPSLEFGGSPASENMLRATESVFLVFNQAVNKDSVVAQLTGEDGKESLSMVTRIGATGNVLELVPSVSLEAGREYNLAVRAASADTGSVYTATGYFFSGEPLSPIAPAVKSVQYDDTGTQDGLLNSGENVYVNFSVPLGLINGVGGLQAFINADLDGNGTIGNAFGETGNANGFSVNQDEPNGLPDGAFILKSSGYTSRFRFQYFGLTNIGPQTMVRLAFEKVQSPFGEYQTIWGEAVLNDLTAGLTVQP